MGELLYGSIKIFNRNLKYLSDICYDIFYITSEYDNGNMTINTNV